MSASLLRCSKHCRQISMFINLQKRPFNVAMICRFRTPQSFQKHPQLWHVRPRGPGSRYLSPCRLFSPLFLQEHEKRSALPKRLRNICIAFPKNPARRDDVCSSVFPFARNIPKTNCDAPVCAKTSSRKSHDAFDPSGYTEYNLALPVSSFHQNREGCSICDPTFSKDTANLDMAMVLLLMIFM